MEAEAKNSKKQRNRKRRKSNPPDQKLKAVIQPEHFDGMTNWLKLQKVENFLLLASKVFLKTLQPFLLIPSFLFCIFSECLIFFHQVLTTEKKCKDSSATATTSHPHHSNFKKKYQEKKKINKNKESFNNSLPKATHKFNFSERKSSIMASQNNTSDRLSDSEANETETNQSALLTKALAMDCEMVGTGPDGADSMLARVSIVNSFGDTVYDTFVAPKEKVTDYRTEVSGVRPSDLQNGKDLFEVQKDVCKIIEGRKIVGHDLKHDFQVLFLNHPKSLIRDTSRYKPFRDLSGGRTPSLKKLVAKVLGCNIQSGEHNSVEDAQAAMLLYLKHKHAWEKSLQRKRKNKPAT